MCFYRKKNLMFTIEEIGSTLFRGDFQLVKKIYPEIDMKQINSAINKYNYFIRVHNFLEKETVFPVQYTDKDENFSVRIEKKFGDQYTINLEFKNILLKYYLINYHRYMNELIIKDSNDSISFFYYTDIDSTIINKYLQNGSYIHFYDFSDRITCAQGHEFGLFNRENELIMTLEFSNFDSKSFK